jgi:pectin methylesterase-like acyl-CoA thioesterase
VTVADALVEHPVRDLNTGLSYSTIQEAINNAVDGDIIFVRAGTYYEHVVVDRSSFSHLFTEKVANQ